MYFSLSVYRNHPVCASPSRIAGSVSRVTKQEINQRSIRCFSSIERCAWTPSQDIATRSRLEARGSVQKNANHGHPASGDIDGNVVLTPLAIPKKRILQGNPVVCLVTKIAMHQSEQKKIQNKLQVKKQWFGVSVNFFALLAEKNSPTVSSTSIGTEVPEWLDGLRLVGWKRFRKAYLRTLSTHSCGPPHAAAEIITALNMNMGN